MAKKKTQKNSKKDSKIFEEKKTNYFEKDIDVLRNWKIVLLWFLATIKN